MEESNISLNSKENADMISDETKSDTLEAHSESSASDENNRISFFEKESCIKPKDDSSTPSKNCPDIATEPEVPSSIIDDDDKFSSTSDISMNSSSPPPSSSNSSADMDYYENDEDLERFCEQEMSISTRNNSGIERESLKILVDPASSNNETGASTEIMLEGAEATENPFNSSVSSSAALNTELHTTALNTEWHTTALNTEWHTTAWNTELHTTALNTELHTTALNTELHTTALNTKLHITALNTELHTTALNTELHTTALNEYDLLTPCLKFFANNPVVGEIVDRNELITSRYFTDEFALQHGLTVDENEVSVRNELEHDTMMESSDLEVRRLRELLEWRPFCILMTLFTFYLYSRYSY